MRGRMFRSSFEARSTCVIRGRIEDNVDVSVVIMRNKTYVVRFVLNIRHTRVA